LLIIVVFVTVNLSKSKMEQYTGTIVNLWNNYNHIILDIGRRILIAVLIIICGRIIIIVAKRLTHRAVKGKLKFDETLASVLYMVIKYAVIIICIIMLLEDFGVSTTSLIALLGAAGVAIGFALKDTLSNIAAGIINLILRPYKKGDFIECGSVMGTVKEMGLFSTILETPDGIFISAPNSSLWGVPLRNFSYNLKRRMEIPITISYSDSIDTAFEVFRSIISSEPRFLSDPPAQIIVQSLGENGVGVTLRAWVPGSMFWPVYWEQMKNVKEKIEEAGLTIAFPRREIHVAKNGNKGEEKKQPLSELTES